MGQVPAEVAVPDGGADVTPEEASAYFDDPARALWVCGLLMSARPGWQVWRGEDRIWRARRGHWPPEPLAGQNAGLVNLAMAYADGGDVA